jgi:alanine racemase
MISRRRFLSLSAGLSALAMAPPSVSAMQNRTVRLRPGGHDDGFDPWLEIIGDHFRHNAREVSRLAGGRPILAVVKNNAYGMGDTIVGPLLAGCAEIGGIACVRPAEALAMRSAGVRKPILTMSEVGDEEAIELVRRDVTLSCWLDGAGDRLERVAKRAPRPARVHLYIDTGMNREGMPWRRALATRRRSSAPTIRRSCRTKSPRGQRWAFTG